MSSSSAQQTATRAFFNAHADYWRAYAAGDLPNRVLVPQERNNYALRVAEIHGGVGTALDVGCGTGDLACELGRRGANAIGIDFAPEMIRRAEENAAQAGVAKNVHFVTTSVFDYSPPNPVDLIVANGFIEYISATELDQFLTRARGWLASNGRLVLGSRNRLFNLYSLNEYTRLELELGAVDALSRESCAIAESANVADALRALEQLARTRAPLPRIERYPDSSIGVAIRHQYTPGELVDKLAKASFSPTELWPIHVHEAPPAFAKSDTTRHAVVSALMQETGDHRLIPTASSFMVTAM